MGRNDQSDRKFFAEHAATSERVAERARAAGEHDKAEQAEANVHLAEQQIRRIDARNAQ